MNDSRKFAAGIFGVLLAGALAAVWWTGDSAGGRGGGSAASVIDRRLLDTARQMAPIAETPPEQDLSRQVLRLADHELDQSFATAVREAASTKPTAAPGVLDQLNARIAQARARIAAGQVRIAKLEKSAEKDDQATGQLEVAKAQLALDQDELEDAQMDSARQGGDERARLERAAQEHADAQREPAAIKPAPIGETKTLGAQVVAWIELANRRSQLQKAQQQAVRHTSALDWEHNTLEGMISQGPAAATDAAAPSAAADSSDVGEDTSAIATRLRNLADQRKTLTELDRRIQDSQQLAEAYKSWDVLVQTRQRGVLHQLLRSLALVLGVMLGAVILEIGARRSFRDQQDRRRKAQERFLASLAIRAAALLVILLIIFGPPSQTPTIIGLATAGMTVVLRDFIVAFFGWLVLIGRHGVRVGDWVEIKGVGGEVIEIGIFKTVLLEMGNWTDTGHPTGRRVSFMNGYAIEGVYFNFSTAGQWLWDELQVTVPAGGDPYGTAQRIREVVEKETDADAKLAEQDWERITKQYGTRAFSARPAVDLRPGTGGLDLHVRYITRGPQRYEVKSRLFEEIVKLMREPAS
jgi:small-conductance mechanosensitive channel